MILGHLSLCIPAMPNVHLQKQPKITASCFSALTKWRVFFFFFPSFNFKVTVSLGRTEQNHFLSLDVTLASKQKQKTNDSRAYLEVQARRLMWNWSFLSSVKRKRYAANGRAMHLFFLILLLLFLFFSADRSPVRSRANIRLHKQTGPVSSGKIAVLIALWVNHHVSLSGKWREAADDR